eukprot:scaffold208319_cov17-Tisochrysis_lutea.AAC.1
MAPHLPLNVSLISLKYTRTCDETLLGSVQPHCPLHPAHLAGGRCHIVRHHLKVGTSGSCSSYLPTCAWHEGISHSAARLLLSA